MGGESSKTAVPPWVPHSAPSKRFSPAVEQQICALSQTSKAFLETPDPALLVDFYFDTQIHLSVLEGAMKHDPRISQWLPRLVPKKIAEEQFWRNYLAHVHVLTRNAEMFDSPEEAAVLTKQEAAPQVSPEPEEPLGPYSLVDEEKAPLEFMELESICEMVTADIGLNSAQIQATLKASKVRWGIIGSGKIVRQCAARAIQKLPGCEFTALYSLNARDHSWIDPEHRPSIHTSLSSFLTCGIDAIYVAIPPGQHLAIAQVLAESKKPVLFERPLGRSAEEARAIIDKFHNSIFKELLEQSLDTPLLFVTNPKRFDPKFLLAREVIRHHLGTITGVTSVYADSSCISSESLGWRVQPVSSGGGLFVQVASDLFDVLDFLFGSVHSFSGVAHHVSSGQDKIENVVSFQFELDQGALGTGLCNFCSSGNTDEIVIMGTHAKLTMSLYGDDFPRIQYSDNTIASPTLSDKTYPTCYTRMFAYTSHVLRSGQNALISPSALTALESWVSMDAILRCFYRARDDDYWTRPETWLL